MRRRARGHRRREDGRTSTRLTPLPAPCCGRRRSGAHNGHDNDSALLLAHKLTIKLPYTFEPGPLGGVLTDMAMADGSVYLATVDLPVT